MKAKLQHLILIVLIVISVSAAAGTWTSIDFAGAQNTSVLGIDGNKIVGSYSTGFPYEHGFVYDGTTWTTVDCFVPASNGTVRGG